MTLGRLSAVIATLALAVPVPAVPVPAAIARHRHAHRRPVAQPDPVALAVYIAQLFWGRSPCKGDVRVVLDAPPSWGDPTAIAWSSANNLFAEPDGSYDPVDAAGLTGCQVHLNTNVWVRMAANDAISVQREERRQWDLLCVVVAHEFGHLLGYGHTTDPRSIMTPGESVRNEPAQCKQLYANDSA